MTLANDLEERPIDARLPTIADIATRRLPRERFSSSRQSQISPHHRRARLSSSHSARSSTASPPNHRTRASPDTTPASSRPRFRAREAKRLKKSQPIRDRPPQPSAPPLDTPRHRPGPPPRGHLSSTRPTSRLSARRVSALRAPPRLPLDRVSSHPSSPPRRTARHPSRPVPARHRRRRAPPARRLDDRSSPPIVGVGIVAVYRRRAPCAGRT